MADYNRTVEIPRERFRQLLAIEAAGKAIYEPAPKPDGNEGMVAVPLELIELLGDALWMKEER